MPANDSFCLIFWLGLQDLDLTISILYVTTRFPKDVKTYGIDKQFLWGRSLLVTPVLDPGVNHVVGYFPEGLWYDYYTVRLIKRWNE